MMAGQRRATSIALYTGLRGFITSIGVFQAYEDTFLIWLQTLYNFAFLFVDSWLGMVEVMVLFVMSEKRARH